MTGVSIKSYAGQSYPQQVSAYIKGVSYTIQFRYNVLFGFFTIDVYNAANKLLFRGKIVEGNGYVITDKVVNARSTTTVTYTLYVSSISSDSCTLVAI